MRKALCLALLISQFFVIGGFWFWNHWKHPMGNQLAGEAAGQLLAYGRLTGILAAFLILLQILLVGRVKWFEKAFGLDRLTHLHGVIGFSVVLFLVAHPILVTMGHAINSGTGRWEQFVDFCRNWEGVMAATIGFGIMVVAVVFSIGAIKRRLKYETWYWIHFSFYLAIALAFGHQIEVGSDFADNRWFRTYWELLYFFTFGNLIFYRIVLPVWKYRRHRFRVAAVVPETADVNSVRIEGDAMEKFRIRAGQFLIVRFLAKGFRWQEHPFSMSCLPDGKHLRISIKALGDYTRRIPELRPGTRVIVDGPHGIFTADRCRLGKALMVAGGIGITPIRSVGEELLAKGCEVVIVFCNRNRASIVFEKELEALAAKSGGRLKLIHILSADPSWQGEKGPLDRDSIGRLVPDFAEREIFLCGPPPMMKSLRKALASLGVPGGRIHFEKFSF